MVQTLLTNGSRQVEIVADAGVVRARLYVNDGETATSQSWKGKTIAGATQWAKAVLA